ncbi:MAG: hypothetical protein WCC22_03210 [Terriglobales bacterium]
MGQEEHAAKAKQGTAVWNIWRNDHPNVKPDRISENETLIRAVFEQRAHKTPVGLRYVVLKLLDGRSTFYTFVFAIALKPPSYTISASNASPASISAGRSATAMVTVTSQGWGIYRDADLHARPSAMLQRRTTLFYAFWLPIPGLALIGFGLGSRGSCQMRLLGWLLFCTVLAGLIFVPACVSSGHLVNIGTPPGPYTISITGVDSSGLTQAGNISTVRVTVTQLRTRISGSQGSLTS